MITQIIGTLLGIFIGLTFLVYVLDGKQGVKDWVFTIKNVFMIDRK